MLNTNLLPDTSRKIVQYEISRRLILRSGIVILFALGVFTVLLLPSYYLLVFQEEGISLQLELERKGEALLKAENVAVRIRQTNQRLKDIYSLREKNILPTSILIKVFSKMGEGVTLKSLSYEFSARDVSINGHAPTREQFLFFEKSLKEDESFQKLISPVSNVLEAANIDYSLKFSLSDKFKNE